MGTFILIGIASLFILPMMLRLALMIVGRGSVGIISGVLSISRIAVVLGRYLLIPLATFVLFAPDLWKSYLPASSQLIGCVILIVAALVLMFEMFKGLGSALAISFWGIICVVVMGAFHLEKFIPQDLHIKLPIQTTSLPQQVPTAQAQQVHGTGRGHDVLEYSSFSLHPPASQANSRPTTQFLDKDVVKLPVFDYSDIQNSITGALPTTLDIFNPHDQSFHGLSSDNFFNSRVPKHQFYGFSSSQNSGLGLGTNGSSQSGGSLLDQPMEYFKKILGK